MITITPTQTRYFDDHVRQRFAVQLTGQLSQDYSEIFQPMPLALAERMVAGKIDYAQDRYSIEFQSALTTYLHYCCAIGPRFDEQPEIQAILDDLSLYPDDIPDLLADRASKEAWAEAEANARRSDWFKHDDAHRLTDHIAARTCWALATIGQQQPNLQLINDDARLTQFIVQAMQTAQKQQITDVKGITAFAVCQAVMGQDFYQRHGKDWVAPIFQNSPMLPWLRGTALALGVELEWHLEL